MKKLFLLSSMVAVSLAAQAQYTLSGASPYNQNFDGIGGGLPTGWMVYSGSSATSIGTLETFSTSVNYGIWGYDTVGTSCGASSIFGGGHKNFPSYSAVSMHPSCTDMTTASNRALGVRQVAPGNTSHPNLDSGAAFVFQIANTAGITNLGCSFKLQSLDTAASRTTTWRVQYRIGTSGSWVEVSPTGTMTTGGHAFTNNSISASFGTALDNQSSPIWFRIVTIDFSSGSGLRPITAIDDFQLTWTGSAGINDVAAQATLPLSVVSASTSAIVLNFDAENAGEHTVVLTDLAGRTVATKVIAAGRGNQNITIDGVNLAAGMYIAKITNGVATGVTKVAVQ